MDEVLESQPLLGAQKMELESQRIIDKDDPRIRVSTKVNYFERRRRLKKLKEVVSYGFYCNF
jgi:hypothetical protein